jgi:hypothetical protein
MKTNTETTHKQNVINLELLITVITTFGEKYNPPVDRLTIPILSDLLKKGKLSLEGVTTSLLANNAAKSALNELLSGFDSRITRVINADFAALLANKEVVTPSSDNLPFFNKSDKIGMVSRSTGGLYFSPKVVITVISNSRLMTFCLCVVSVFVFIDQMLFLM